jgi:hypothetical protein
MSKHDNRSAKAVDESRSPHVSIDVVSQEEAE